MTALPPASLAEVTIWGWGHCLGVAAGRAEGWRVMLQISSLSPTERAHHAHEKVRDEDLSQWDTLVVMSGDGLLFEVRGTLGLGRELGEGGAWGRSQALSHKVR